MTPLIFSILIGYRATQMPLEQSWPLYAVSLLLWLFAWLYWIPFTHGKSHR